MLETARITENDKRAILAQLVGKVDNEKDETVFKATVVALKMILGESKKVDNDETETGVQVLDSLITQEEQEVLALFRKNRYNKNTSNGKPISKNYTKPVLKPKNPVDPNTGMIMRCSSCDAKTHLVKDCYERLGQD